MRSYIHSSFLTEQYVTSNIILKSYMVSIKWTYHNLSNQYSIDLHFFQIFTNINNSLMNFSMHVLFYNCIVILEKLLDVTFLSANSLKISNKKNKFGPLWKIYCIYGTQIDQILPFETDKYWTVLLSSWCGISIMCQGSLEHGGRYC